jgi:inner membrane protein
MPTIFSHPAVPLAIGFGLGRKVTSAPLLVCAVIGSVLPDIDVVAFRMGILYAAEFGHRGFSHSLLFAFVAALLGACLFRWFQTEFSRSFLFLFAAIGSHGLLDTLTNGGLGIALLWPWSVHRYFMPFHPIEVAPLGLSGLLSQRGLWVLKSELYWVWLPAFTATVLMIFARLTLTKVSIGRETKRG